MKYKIISEEKLERLIEKKAQEYVERINESYEREILKRKMDMKALQNQINPHFLYNSLECIRGQAMLYDVPEIADTAQALSKFFRYSINTKSDTVTLKEELDNVEDYMKIQQYRFRDRFFLQVVCEESDRKVLMAVLPKLTLQPIVENAIMHGFADKLKDNRISVRIIMTAKHVNIIVADNGKGMDAETLQRLNYKLNHPQKLEEVMKGNHSGIGLDNVNRRIRFFFGEEYGLTVRSVMDMGTDVEIHIPLTV